MGLSADGEVNEMDAYAIPVWLVVPVLLLVLVGGWKLAKIIWAALSH